MQRALLSKTKLLVVVNMVGIDIAGNGTDGLATGTNQKLWSIRIQF